MTSDLGQDTAAPVYCDSCGERTATPPVCEDCRAERIANLTEVLAAGWTLSREQALWLLAEVGRLRDTLTRRGEEYDAVRAERDGLREREGRRLTRTFDQMAAALAQVMADCNRLATQVSEVRQALNDHAAGEIGEALAIHECRAALDGEVPS